MSIYNLLYIDIMAYILYKNRKKQEKTIMANLTLRQWEKIKAVVLYILQQFPQGVDYIHLFKIMYFSQQQHLMIYGMPLFEDSFAAHKHGPVPVGIYGALKAVEGKERKFPFYQWALSSIDVQEKDGHPLVSIKEGMSYDAEELSESNTEILDAVIAQLKDIPSYELSNMSHKDKAYQTARRHYMSTGEDALIPMVAIAKSGGASPAMQKVIRERLLVRDALE